VESALPFALEELEDFEGLRGSGVSEIERRLINAGYVFEPSRAGKHFWVQPETGRWLPEDHAFALVREEESRRLAEAGWESVEIEGSPEAYWRRPDTGRLYPRGPAVDVLRQREAREVREGLGP
jgi:hypothetical protein